MKLSAEQILAIISNEFLLDNMQVMKELCDDGTYAVRSLIPYAESRTVTGWFPWTRKTTYHSMCEIMCTIKIESNPEHMMFPVIVITTAQCEYSDHVVRVFNHVQAQIRCRARLQTLSRVMRCANSDLGTIKQIDGLAVEWRK